jgi:antitoxin component HigA of HigAB toxin-antitoxin module
MLMVERYESEHVTVKAPDPVTAIEFAIEKSGLTPSICNRC